MPTTATARNLSPFSRLLAACDEPAQALVACNSPTLQGFEHEDWYFMLPPEAVTLWPSFSPEARATVLHLAARVSALLNADLPGADN